MNCAKRLPILLRSPRVEAVEATSLYLCPDLPTWFIERSGRDVFSLPVGRGDAARMPTRVVERRI
jgi:hypothetical protein